MSVIRLETLGAGLADGPEIAVHSDARKDFRSAGYSILGQGRLVSHSMGEHDRRSVVWDYIVVYRELFSAVRIIRDSGPELPSNASRR